MYLHVLSRAHHS